MLASAVCSSTACVLNSPKLQRSEIPQPSWHLSHYLTTAKPERLKDMIRISTPNTEYVYATPLYA